MLAWYIVDGGGFMNIDFCIRILERLMKNLII